MNKKNFEEGIKRIAIVTWFIWVVYIFYISDSFTYNNFSTAYYEPEYFGEVCLSVENFKNDGKLGGTMFPQLWTRNL